MKKQLNVDAIQNELRGNSAFFPRYKEEQAATPTPTATRPAALPEAPKATVKQTREASPSPTEQAPKQSLRRSFVRRSFDFYEDQIAYLTKESLEERLAGKDSSMNAMLREAVDDYIKKRTSGK